MNATTNIAGFFMAVATLVLTACEGPAAPAGPDRGYSALQSLPDWRGTWSHGADALGALSTQLQQELSPESSALVAQMSRELIQGSKTNLKVLHCQPPAFAGYNGGFEGAIEFLFNPGRVTLLWEGGLVRRIYTDGRRLPPDVDVSNAGTSVGHWEGDTLVVETAGLNPGALPFALPGDKLHLGPNAHITEHIRLKSPDVLQIDTTMTAPALAPQPVTYSLQYQRNRDRAPQEFTWCVENDRSLDPVTGTTRFDMTAPVDLPAPPKA